MTHAERRKYSQEVAAINKRLESAWFPKVKKAVRYPFIELATVIERRGMEAGRRWVTTYKTNRQIGPTLRAMYRQVGLRFARRINAQLQAEPMKLKRDGRLGLNQEWIAFLQEYLESDNISKAVLWITQTNRASLIRAMDEAVARGLGIDDAVRLIRNWPGTEYQAARVVRTEVNRAANAGMLAASSTFGFEQQKEWISAEDKRVRGLKPKDHASHVALDGKVIDYGETWTDPRNGDELQAPGDPKASAASVINCRCTMAVTAKRDANGRLIRKQPQRSRVSVILPGAIPRRQIITV